MTEWWDPQYSGLIGGLGGGGLGTLGGLYGALVGWLAPKGIGRTPIMATHWIFLLIGAVALIAGIVAVVGGQPYHVYYPLLLIGFLLSALMGGLLPVVKLRYRQAEQRKLDAESFRRG